MKRYVLAVAMIVLALFCVVKAQEPTANAPAASQERTVVVPEDKTPFTVEKNDVVRLTGKGIAGATFVAKVEGPAKMIAKNRVSLRKNGKPPVGPGNEEFEIKATDKGKVTVAITMTPPMANAEKTVTNYEFEVK
jgi:hypothetical protein